MECHSFMHHVVFGENAPCTHSFEDCDDTVLELKLLMLKVLYDWIAVSGCLSFLNLFEILDLFVFFLIS